jgi:hypothetical protein
MKNYRNNIDINKNLINYTECKKLIEQQDMKYIGEGGQANVFKIESEKCGSVVLKLFKEMNGKELIINEKLLKEYEIMSLIKILIEYNYCPNFISIIDFNFDLKYIIMEYADGDCVELFKNNTDYNILSSFMCQILIGLLCFHKKIEMWHNDFKLKNILYKKIDKNVILHYKINEENYYIPTHGYLIMIADFGHCLKNTYINKDSTTKHNDFLDYDRLKNSLSETIKKIDGDTENIKKIKEILNDRITILEIINKNFSFYKNNSYDSKYIETFVFNF